MTAAEVRVGGRALTRLALQQIHRGALVVTAVSAGMAALVVATYRANAIDPAALAALAQNPAIRTLFGAPVALDQPGGFTVWRTGTVLAVLIAAWAMLATTRITRGEEDTGRWSLLLAGSITLPRAVRYHLGVLMTAPVLAGAATAAAMIAAGGGSSGALLYGTGLALLGVFFVGVAGLAAQVLPSRSAASGAAATVLVVGLLARMVGDGVAALSWLRWFSPYGLLALSSPYEANRGLPLVVLLGGAVALLAAAVRAAALRDVGGAVVAPSAGRNPRRALLGSVQAFAVRRMLRPLAGWSVGVGAYFLLIGLIARSMTAFLTDNPQFAQLAAQAGFELGSVEGYAATLFGLLAVPAGVFVAVRLAAAAGDETNRRLVLLLATPVTRTRLLAAEAAAAVGGAAVMTAGAGFAAWAGTVASGAGLSIGAALAGACNVLPIVFLCLGTAVLALGWEPRAVAAIGALPAVGGFVWLVVADSIRAPIWVGELSPFAHLAAVPAHPPDWVAATVMTAVSAVLATIGAVGYRRRDIRAG
ncbi:hypothetical protein [Krasilnikovia sp. M28-CT-15]|uniref:hypothetical protein n=1 Tax=Krasilnikovia sp. M28-CT-15 TaxID=3373540 RepID=UPI0038763D19